MGVNSLTILGDKITQLTFCVEYIQFHTLHPAILGACYLTNDTLYKVINFAYILMYFPYIFSFGTSIKIFGINSRQNMK